MELLQLFSTIQPPRHTFQQEGQVSPTKPAFQAKTSMALGGQQHFKNALRTNPCSRVFPQQRSTRSTGHSLYPSPHDVNKVKNKTQEAFILNNLILKNSPLPSITFQSPYLESVPLPGLSKCKPSTQSNLLSWVSLKWVFQPRFQEQSLQQCLLLPGAAVRGNQSHSAPVGKGVWAHGLNIISFVWAG